MESASSPQTALGLLDFWRSLLSVLLSIEVRIEEILLPCRFRAMGLHTISEFQLRQRPPAIHLLSIEVRPRERERRAVAYAGSRDNSSTNETMLFPFSSRS